MVRLCFRATSLLPGGFQVGRCFWVFLVASGTFGGNFGDNLHYFGAYPKPLHAAKTSARCPAQVVALQRRIEVVSDAAKTSDFAAQRAIHSLPKNPLRGVSAVGLVVNTPASVRK